MQKEELVSLEKKKKILIIIVIVIIVLVIGAISIFVINSLNKKEEFDLETDFFQVAMTYYENSSESLPDEVGECTILTLETLLAKSKIDSPEEYDVCNKYNTYVKSCKLESGEYHYVPVFSCNGINSESQYSEWQDGIEKDITSEDDVRFLFQGYYRKQNEQVEVLEGWKDEVELTGYDILSSVTYYRYRNMEWRWQEIKQEYYTNNDSDSALAYYTISPDAEYLNSDSETTVYKWYTQKQENTISYPTYVCQNDLGNLTSSNEVCETRIDGYTETHKIYETCGVLNSTSVNENDKYVEVEPSTICESKIIKTYYPSGSEDVSQEKVYYKYAPVENAIKDLNTRTVGARYYKDVAVVTDNYYPSSPSSTSMKTEEYRWGEWTSYSTTKPKQYDSREIETREKISYILAQEDTWQLINENYLSKEDLLAKIKELDYEDINTLEDINNSIDLKYNLKMQYRKKNN